MGQIQAMELSTFPEIWKPSGVVAVVALEATAINAVAIKFQSCEPDDTALLSKSGLQTSTTLQIQPMHWPPHSVSRLQTNPKPFIHPVGLDKLNITDLARPPPPKGH